MIPIAITCVGFIGYSTSTVPGIGFLPRTYQVQAGLCDTFAVCHNRPYEVIAPTAGFLYDLYNLIYIPSC